MHIVAGPRKKRQSRLLKTRSRTNGPPKTKTKKSELGGVLHELAERRLCTAQLAKEAKPLSHLRGLSEGKNKKTRGCEARGTVAAGEYAGTSRAINTGNDECAALMQSKAGTEGQRPSRRVEVNTGCPP